MRSREQILESLNDGIGPFTEASVIQAKALEAILETLLDIRDLQLALNERPPKPKSRSPRTPG
jgi:hypothetical protein